MFISKTKKGLSLILAIIMVFTMMPATIFSLGANESYPMMYSFNAASSKDFHNYYKQVYTITFLDKIDYTAMNNAIEYWDISANTNSGEVMGWMYLNQEATNEAKENRYDVYVAGEGGVAAHPDTTHMFYAFASLKEIKGMENFHTGEVKSFYYWFGNCGELEVADLSKLDTSSATTLKFMFYACYKLKEADLDSWNVSNVTTLERMFYRCYALKYADLSGWDTRNITNMYGVFEMTPPNGVSPDYSLEKIDLTGWDTSNVTTMENMFKNCEVLRDLDLSSFDTSKVTTMRFMFYYCKHLKYVYIGKGWTTEAVKNINDGVFNCCYALAGGTDDQAENEKIYAEKHPSAYYPPSVEYAKTKEEGGYLTDVSHKPEPEVTKYTVTYSFAGEIIPDGVTAPDAAKYEEGTKVTVESDAFAEGYEFSGWSTSDAEVLNGEFTINNDVHFVGSWSKVYNVTYKYADEYEVPDGAPADLPEGGTYKASEVVDVADDYFVDGFVFEGWTPVDGDVTVTAEGKFVMPQKDVVLEGYFRKPVTSIEIDNSTINGELVLNKDETTTIIVTVKPEDATIKSVSYDSGNDEIVIVDEDGNVTAVGAGTTTITVSSTKDPEISTTVTVTVKVPVTDITVDKNEITLNKGETDKIDVTVNPNDATNKNVTYEVDKEGIIEIDENGNITAVDEGTVEVTVRSEDNPSVTETVTVTVKIPVTEVTVKENEITLNVGEEKNVEAAVNEDATNKGLIYESDNAGVVKIDNDGNIIAVGEGEATITVTSKDDPSKKETITVTVKIPVTEVTVKENEITLNVGEEKNVEASVNEDATNKEITYESSDETVVKVDKDGNIEAVGEGEAVITVTSKDDPAKKETITVTVKIPVEDVDVEKTEITLNKGDKDKIEVTVTPDDATNKDLTYESSDEKVVKVDENGNIEAVGEGEAVITVTSKDDPSKKETITVTVKIPVSDVVIGLEEITIDEGKKIILPVKVNPDDATDKNVTYESSDETVVKVDKDGNVEAVKEGTAVITVTSKDDPTKKDEVTIIVKKPVVKVEKVEVDDEEITLVVGGKEKIEVTVTPDDATDKTVTFESSDEKVVKVDKDGNIEAVGGGEAIITVKTNDGASTTVKVTVVKEYKVTYEFIGKDIPAGVKAPGGEIYVSGSVVDVKPDASAEGYVFSGWSTDDAEVSNGEFVINNDVHFVGSWSKLYNVTYVYEGSVPAGAPLLDSYKGKYVAGEAVVVKDAPNVKGYNFSGWSTSDATIVGGGFEMPEKDVVIKGSFEKVNIAVDGIVVNKNEITLQNGSKDKITATVTPENATNKGVTYESTNEKVVKVDKDGNITAVGMGEAEIIITSKGDPTKKETVKVTVTKVPVSVVTAPEKIKLVLGEEADIQASVNSNATYKGLTYTSNDESVAKVDANGKITSVGEGTTKIIVRSVDNPAVYAEITVVVNVDTGINNKHYMVFGKTEKIGWYSVSFDGGETFQTVFGNSNLVVDHGTVAIIRANDIMGDPFTFYINGKAVTPDENGYVTVKVDGYVLVGALGIPVIAPDADESLNFFQKIIKAIKDFFAKITAWFKK